MFNESQSPILFDGNHFDCEFRDRLDDIAFYRNLAGVNSLRILELGVGTCRIAIPLALDGHRVTGLDLSKSMLRRGAEKATEKQADLELVECDVRTFSRTLNSFELVIAPFNFLLHFNNADLQLLLVRISDMLCPGGRLIVDVANPFSFHCGPGTRTNYSTEYPNPYGSGQVVVSTESQANGNCLEMTRIFRSQSGKLLSKEKLIMYHYSQALWATMLADAGFEISNEFGFYDRSAYRQDSRCLLIESRPSKQERRGHEDKKISL